MKIEDIEKLLKVGCKVQLDTRDFPIEITHLDAEYVWNHENGHATRHNWRSIKDIVSWPKPLLFEQKHVGHWIKLVDEKRSSLIGILTPYIGEWFIIETVVSERPSITVKDRKGSIVFSNQVSLCHIGDYRPIPPVEVTPISDDEFNALQPGNRLKIATAEYIDSKCDYTGYYKETLQGSNRVDNGLKRHYGNDSAEVKNLLCNGIVSIKEGYTIHRDFIVGVIKMQEKKPYPLVECKDFSILRCEVGDFVKLNSEHPSWMKVIDPSRHRVKFSGGGESHVYNDIKYRIQNFFSFPDSWFYRVKGVWYQYPSDSGAFWGDVEAISETLPLHGEIATGSPQPNVLQIKEEEKIMLNTVEEIKQLDAKNIEEAAKKVKQNRDNAEVKQASEKLTQLLDRKESLEASKRDIDKQLKEVNDLVEALGYPPKE